MSGLHQLVLKLLCGSGFRITVWFRLRVRDVGLKMKAPMARNGKRVKDRITTFPEKFVQPLKDGYLRQTRRPPRSYPDLGAHKVRSPPRSHRPTASSGAGGINGARTFAPSRRRRDTRWSVPPSTSRDRDFSPNSSTGSCAAVSRIRPGFSPPSPQRTLTSSEIDAEDLRSCPAALLRDRSLWRCVRGCRPHADTRMRSAVPIRDTSPPMRVPGHLPLQYAV